VCALGGSSHPSLRQPGAHPDARPRRLLGRAERLRPHSGPVWAGRPGGQPRCHQGARGGRRLPAGACARGGADQRHGGLGWVGGPGGLPLCLRSGRPDPGAVRWRGRAHRPRPSGHEGQEPHGASATGRSDDAQPLARALGRLAHDAAAARWPGRALWELQRTTCRRYSGADQASHGCAS